jgi:hypothetical protein
MRTSRQKAANDSLSTAKTTPTAALRELEVQFGSTDMKGNPVYTPQNGENVVERKGGPMGKKQRHTTRDDELSIFLLMCITTNPPSVSSSKEVTTLFFFGIF